ncbi:MAG: MXAN_5187 C-terminal domain-containing protein [Myxococcota bacterium]
MPARAELIDGKKTTSDSEDAIARCAELEAELAELRAAYDLYFQGVERLPPLKKHDAFKRAFQKLKGSSIRQTAAKFRVETLGQKLLTYERLWDRTLKEIEAGTFKRDLARLKRRDHRLEKKKKDGVDSDFDVDEDLDLSDLESEGHDDLSAALAAAEAALSAPPPVKPAAPAIAPVAAKPATGVAPAITPVTPAGGTKPATGVAPAIKPLTPAIPPGTPAGGAKAVPPKITSGAFPAIAPATSSQPPKPAAAATAARPGSNPPAARPATTGSSPALKPAASPSRPPAPVGADGGLSDQKIKAIYDAYVMAKKRCGEDTRAVTLDSVASSLKKQVPELMKQHNARSVEFKVVIKDGKAVLRALPKE